jgi:O-antigen biosynthesis protein WbqP
VKIDSIRLELKWTPPFTVSQGLEATIEWYKKKNEIERKKFLKRILDLFIASFATVLLFIPMMIVALLVKITSVGPILYWSERVGAGNITFKMPKFRTMRLGTPVVATHLLTNPSAYLTPIGNFLRMTSLDELPQILCIFQGSMSWVGPRPALYNQLDLISLRTNLGVHQLIPGVTGLAQVNGRDELDIPTKVQYDKEYLMNQSLRLDIKILILTIVKVLKRQNINH